MVPAPQIGIIIMSNFEIFLAAYVEAMLWSTSGTDQHGEEVESLEGFELSTEAKRKAKEECEQFLFVSQILFLGLPEWYGKGDGGIYAYAGHDFWLTRNGHGAGFWDRGLGDLGERLTALCKTYGEKDPYVGDDNKIYL